MRAALPGMQAGGCSTAESPKENGKKTLGAERKPAPNVFLFLCPG